jgi:hypothetical protein
MPSAELLKKLELNYEQWRDLVCPNFGLHRVDEPKAFAGRVHFRSIFGFRASEMRNNKFANGHKGIFALMALITAMPYFRSMDDQTITQNDQL